MYRRMDRYRNLALAGMALSLFIVITCHYFAVFILVPLIVGEAAYVLRGKGEIKPWVFLAIGSLGALLDYPFQRAALPFQAHIITETGSAWRMIPLSYYWYIYSTGYAYRLYQIGDHIRTVEGAVLFAGLGALAFFSWRALRESANVLVAEWWALLCFLLIPFLVVPFGMTVVHAFRPRYTFESVLGFLVLLAIWAGPRVNRASARRYAGYVVMVALFCGVFLAHGIRQLGVERRLHEAGMGVPAEAAQMLRADGGLLVFMSIESCMDNYRYGPAETLPRERCLYSEARELRYTGTNTVYLTSKCMDHNTALQFASFDELKRTPKAILVISDQPWTGWIMKSAREEGIVLHPLGKGMGGDMYSVSHVGDIL
jgi:hypothetical protein